MFSVRRFIGLAGLAVTIITGAASAEVEPIEITSRSVFAGGKAFGEVGVYEKIRGRLFYAVDPENAVNVPIVDLARRMAWPPVPVDDYPFWMLEPEKE